MTVDKVASGSPLFAAPNITKTTLTDGTVHLASAEPLGHFGANVVSWVRQWAEVDPDVWLTAERTTRGEWEPLTYGQALSSIGSIGQALLDRGLSKDRPLAILSENSVGHLLCPSQPSGSGFPWFQSVSRTRLQSADHSRLRFIGDLIRPGAIYVEDADEYAGAIDALASRPMILSRRGGPDSHALGALRLTEPTRAVQAASDAVNGDTTAKIMFTSGSTGTPKGVITTHRMLVANQQMLAQVWPFLEHERRRSSIGCRGATPSVGITT